MTKSKDGTSLTDWLPLLPYVHRLAKPRSCDAPRGGMGVAASRLWLRRDPATVARWACKQSAYWRFTALARSRGKSGVYCTHHLFSRGLMADWDEEARTTRWAVKLGVLCPVPGCRHANPHDGDHETGFGDRIDV